MSLRDQKMSRTSKRVNCREIVVADLERIVDLMTDAYRVRSRDLWARRMRRLEQHVSPEGYPRFGFVLECEEALVGIIFTTFSSIFVDGQGKSRCYLSNWYVAPEFRTYASLLAARALQFKTVTYRIGTPIEHVRPIFQAQGHTVCCRGRFIAAPLLSRRSEGARIDSVGASLDEGVEDWERELLLRHAGFGCFSLISRSATGVHPFVFHPRVKAGVIRFARLVYCRDRSDFVRLSAPLGRYLAARGYLLVVLDADGPIPGLIGSYSDKFPKYYKGPDMPRLCETAYSTKIIFDE